MTDVDIEQLLHAAEDSEALERQIMDLALARTNAVNGALFLWDKKADGLVITHHIVEGVTVQPGKYDHEELQLVARTDQSAPLSIELETRIGGRFGGDRITLEPALKYRIGEKFTSELTWSYNDFELPGGDFTINVGKLRATYSFTPSISIQALVQYDDRSDVIATNLRFAWLQSANAGLYLVYNEVDDRDAIGKPQREFILKYSRIFDLL